MEAELVDIIEVANLLGEGVTWDWRTGHVLWADILSSRLYRLDFASRHLEQFDLPMRLGAIGLTADPDLLVCAFEGGFGSYSMQNQEARLAVPVEPDFPGSRLNDGRVDRSGFFWAGSMIEDPEKAPPEGAGVYRFDGKTAERKFAGARVSNGLAWSLNGDTLYFADSPTGVVEAFDCTPSGALSRCRPLIEFEAGASPDGATVDAAGNLWSAIWAKSAVRCISPAGDVLDALTLPTSLPACVAFGGPELDHLFVSTATVDLSDQEKADQPQAGHLFIFKTDRKGLPEPVYSGNLPDK